MTDFLKRAAEVTGNPETAHEVARLLIEEMLAITTSVHSQFYRFTERQFTHETAKRLGIDRANKMTDQKAKSCYDTLISEMIEAKEKAFYSTHLGSDLTPEEMKRVQSEHEAAACAGVVLRHLKTLTGDDIMKAFERSPDTQPGDPFRNYTPGEKQTFADMNAHIIDFFADCYGVEI